MAEFRLYGGQNGTYGGDCRNNISVIQKGAKNWNIDGAYKPLQERSCDYDYKSQLIYFKKTMQCM